MLLRVDVYPTDWAPPSSAAAPQMQQQQQSQRDLAGGEDTDDNFLQPSQTLYACLASSSESQDAGRVLTVGRKVGDVLLSSDKSVSREHMIVRLASVNKTHQKQQEKDDKETIPPPLLATTPEQIQACQEDKYYHMCVLLKNLGKLGSFLVRPAQQDVSKPESKKTASAKDDDDSATDNDETDDEGEGGTQQGASSNFVLPAAAGISLSTVTQLLLQQHYGTTAGATVQPIAMNEQIVLSDLAQQHGHVIVQVSYDQVTLLGTSAKTSQMMSFNTNYLYSNQREDWETKFDPTHFSPFYQCPSQWVPSRCRTLEGTRLSTRIARFQNL